MSQVRFGCSQVEAAEAALRTEQMLRQQAEAAHAKERDVLRAEAARLAEELRARQQAEEAKANQVHWLQQAEHALLHFHDAESGKLTSAAGRRPTAPRTLFPSRRRRVP